MKHFANILTCSRILGSLLLLFFPTFSSEFYLIYIICGLSDMIDGTIARKTNSSSAFGSRLDTIADFIFLVVSLLKILPTIHIPIWLFALSVFILILKISTVTLWYIFKKQFLSLHTIMNKIAGLLLFLLPLTLSFLDIKYSFVVVCFVALFSAIQEAGYVAIHLKTNNNLM